ncbi:MAG TPA: sialidase family protein [Herpetosiphonaceae bacterium]
MQQKRSLRQLFAKIVVCLCALVLGVLSSVALWTAVPTAPAPVAPTAVGAYGGAATPVPTALPPSATPTAPPATPTAQAVAPLPAPAADVPNVRVSAGKFTAHSEVSLAQNPRDPQNLVGASKMFTDNRNYVFRIGTYASFDGGNTWVDNGQLPGLERFGVTSDPTVTFDSEGTAYVEVLAARGPDRRSALYLYTSTDGGKSWSAPQLVADDPTGFNDKQWLAADTTGGTHDGMLYTTWIQIVEQKYRVLFARSADGGKSWSAPHELAGEDGVTRQGPIVAVGARGEVYVLWNNLSADQMELALSVDGGVTFGDVRQGVSFQNTRPLNGNLRNALVLAGFSADPRQPGTLYAVWSDGRLGDADILFSVSRDGGATWRSPVVVNGTQRNDQFQPWVTANGAGEIYVQWFDRRDDPQNLLVHTYAARSTDGGATWSELRVTDTASDPTVGLPLAGEAGFYGDYQALVADAGGVQLFWNETRDGQQEVYTARITPDRWGLPYVVPHAGPTRDDGPAPPDAIEGEE